MIAGEAVIGRSASTHNKDDYYADGTLAKTFRDRFKSGRETTLTCDWNVHRMPNPENGCEGLDEVFGKHIFKWDTKPN